MHPKPSAAEASKLEWQIKVAWNVSRLAAKVLPSWPRLDLNVVPYVRPLAGTAIRPLCRKDNVNGRGARRSGGVANDCAFAGRPLGPRMKDVPRICPPAACSVSARGHACLALKCENDQISIMCTKCKSFGTLSHFKGLRGECTRPLAKAAEDWSRATRGWHPKDPIRAEAIPIRE